MSFEWHPDGPPPEIEPHSKAKLKVLRSYLHAYFDRLNIIPNREEFKLDLIDGFAGGGLFRDRGDTISGTPLIMLEEARAAEERINVGRVKPLKFDCRFYFVDKKTAHTDHLRKALAERGFKPDGKEIIVRNNPFEDELEGILNSIRRRQPRAGRAIFLLDQTGYSQVGLHLISRIFTELPAAEVILTFAVDALINFLSERPHVVKATAPLQLSESQILDLIQHRNSGLQDAVVQRTLRDHIRNATGVNFDTPFFIRPERSRRALWFLHLSQHPTARDVMIQRHWALHNTFLHYGSGDLNMLGWDSLQDSETPPLFNFRDHDAEEMHIQLLDSLPKELYRLASEGPVSIETVRHALANRTAAPFSGLDQVMLQLVAEREFDIIDAHGKKRSLSLSRLSPTDRIALLSTPMFPEMSRRSRRS